MVECEKSFVMIKKDDTTLGARDVSCAVFDFGQGFRRRHRSNRRHPSAREKKKTSAGTQGGLILVADSILYYSYYEYYSYIIRLR